MSVLPHPPDAFLHLFRRDVVEVRHTQVRPFADMLLAFAAAEAHGYGEAGAGAFLTACRFRMLLLQVASMVLGVSNCIRVTSDQFEDFFQCGVSGFHVLVTLEQAENKFVHSMQFLENNISSVKLSALCGEFRRQSSGFHSEPPISPVST